MQTYSGTMISKNLFINLTYGREYGEAYSLTAFRCVSAAPIGVFKNHGYENGLHPRP